MPLILIVFFSLLLSGCGKHEQTSFGRDGVTNIRQVRNAETLSQNIITEDLNAINEYLKAGGNIDNEFPSSGRTLLTEACFWAKFKVIELLMANNADIHYKDRSGKSGADYAEESLKIKRALYPELVLNLKKILFDQVKKNSTTELKKTLEESPPLNFYLTSEEWGENLGLAEGETLLTFCIKNKLENIIRLIVQPKYEIDINMKNKMLESPLMLAKKMELKNTEKILLKLGANE
jgi:hypothetical protein